MRVLIVMPHMGKGGAEEVVLNHINNSYELGLDVNLLLFLNLAEADYNISRLNSRNSIFYLIFRRLLFKSLFKKILIILLYVFSPVFSFILYMRKIRHYDVVHLNLTLPTLYGFYFNLYRKVLRDDLKIVVTFHSNFHLLRYSQKFLNILGWNACDKLVYEIFKNDISNLSKVVKSNKVHYIPFGYEYCHGDRVPTHNDKSQTQKKITDFLSSFNSEIEKPNVLMTISRVKFFEKKIDVMIKTLSELRRAGENWVFILCGDGEDMDKARDLCKSLCICDYVLFTGYVDNPEEIIKYADLYMVAAVDDFTGVSGMQAIANNSLVFGVQTIPKASNLSLDKFISHYCPSKLAYEIKYVFSNEENIAFYLSTLEHICKVNHNNQIDFSRKYIDLIYK